MTKNQSPDSKELAERINISPPFISVITPVKQKLITLIKRLPEET